MKKWVLTLLLLPMLAACINDGASIQLEGRDETVSVLREQKWLWDKQLNLFVVASRLPQCQRRHRMAPVPIVGTVIDAFLVDDSTYLLRQGSRFYLVETQTCEGFEVLQEAPASGLGTPLGSFRAVDGALRFEAAPAS